MTQLISRDFNWPNVPWMTATTGNKEQLTKTVYDATGTTRINQQNLRNRVSYTQLFDTEADYASATYYAYDIHGNVDILLQDYRALNL